MNTSKLFPNGLPADLRAYGIVMPAELREALMQYQQQIGAHRNFVSPVALTDGRYAINCDILSETHPSGIFPDVAWITDDMLEACVVMPWGDVVALLPVSEDEES